MHVDKTVWNGLNAVQHAAILRRAKETVIESYNATESIACQRQKDMLDFNEGVNQRNLDGTLRTLDGIPVSAKITLAPWPDDALRVLREARDAYLASLQGPNNPSDRTDAQRDFSVIFTACRATPRVSAQRTDSIREHFLQRQV